MYLCKMTHTDCSACLPENASCDSMCFFFVNSFVALQSLMMYKVGEPAYLLKNILSNSCSISFPSGVIGLTIVIRLSFWFFTSPIYRLFYMPCSILWWEKYGYILKKYFFIQFKVNLVQTWSMATNYCRVSVLWKLNRELF